MSQFEEFYRLLDVGPDASADEIRQEYLTLVNVWHPDRFAHDPILQGRAMEKLKAINGAFERIKGAPLRNGAASAPAPGPPAAPARNAAEPSPRSAAEWFQLGMRLSSTRVEIKPGESLTWSNIGNLNRHVEGIRAFEEATRLQPDFAEAWYHMGQAHAQFHQFSEAARAFGEAVRLRPGQAAAWINLGAALAQLQRYSEVILAFREAVRLKPDDASAWYTLGAAYTHAQIRRYQDARDAFREAVQLKPDLAEAWHALGRVCMELGSEGEADTVEALDALREAVRLKPDLAEAWCHVGTTLSRRGQHGDAVDAYRQSLRLKPDLLEAWHGLGAAARLSQRPDSGKDVEEAYTSLRRLDRGEAARFLETLPRHQRLWLALRADRRG